MINIQPIEKLSLGDGNSLSVHSIFYTIQGEGPYSGCPAVFIRLAGCNLQCPGCDTDYTVGREILPIEHMLGSVDQEGGYFADMTWPLVVITGGEPFRQNITPLCVRLIRSGYRVQIETNGTLAPSPYLPAEVCIVVSPKTGKVNTLISARANAYKYVLSADSVDHTDGLPILALWHTASPRVARPPEGMKLDSVYLHPMDPGGFFNTEFIDNVAAVKNSCLKHGYRLGLQVHKLIGVA